LAQQPSFTDAWQHALSWAQQASFALQQSGGAAWLSARLRPDRSIEVDSAKPANNLINMEVSPVNG
jgi:hypothetical protein